MAIVLAPVLYNVLSAVRGIRSQADTIRNLPASFPFDQLSRPLDQMGLGSIAVQSFLNTYVNDAEVQAAADKVVLAGLPPAIRARIVDVDTAHGAFATAYAAIYATSGNLVTFSTATRTHGFLVIQLSDVASLATPLNNLIAACDVLAYEG